MEDQQHQKNPSRRVIIQSFQVLQSVIDSTEKNRMPFPTCSVLLLLLVWPASSMPITFCQNTGRQIESIQNLLQIVKEETTRTSLNLTNQRESKPVDQCKLIQRLTDYQACDLSPETKEISYMKAETKGLVDNLQSSKTANCILSPAKCPYLHLSQWTMLNNLLKSWAQDVGTCNNILQIVCPPSNYNSI